MSHGTVSPKELYFPS